MLNLFWSTRASKSPSMVKFAWFSTFWWRRFFLIIKPTPVFDFDFYWGVAISLRNLKVSTLVKIVRESLKKILKAPVWRRRRCRFFPDNKAYRSLDFDFDFD